ncbi:hypothetical protein Mapa_013435 [Marchantia paleacea]|nr:hypothetical protein Mapa_013435 [Marchantia paleacea]
MQTRGPVAVSVLCTCEPEIDPVRSFEIWRNELGLRSPAKERTESRCHTPAANIQTWQKACMRPLCSPVCTVFTTRFHSRLQLRWRLCIRSAVRNSPNFEIFPKHFA